MIKMQNIFEPVLQKGKRRMSGPIWIWVLAMIWGFLVASGSAWAQEARPGDDWPRFGLVFQTTKDYQAASRRFLFYYGAQQKTASQLSKSNKHGIYVPAYGLVRTYPAASKMKFGPDYDYITSRHPEWLLRYLDGSLVTGGPPGLVGPRLDLGKAHYVDYAIGWLRQQAFSGEYPVRDLGFDGCLFYYGIPNTKYGGTPGTELYRASWEYFLRRISEALRPQHKIIINVGSCDLPTFARMIRWVDGVLFEDLCEPLHNPKFDVPKARETILDRWQKGRWCVEHGKVWAVRYNATINTLKISSRAGAPASFLSLGDRELIVIGPGQKVLGKIDFSQPEGATLAKVAQSLAKFNIDATVVSPYPESSPLGALQHLNYIRVEDGLTLKLKQAPREAFLFGYVAVLMATGPNTYFIMGDERCQDYYYPEMDQPVGPAKGERSEVAPQIFRRDFKNYAAFLNLSEAPFTLPDSRALAPFRGALVPISR